MKIKLDSIRLLFLLSWPASIPIVWGYSLSSYGPPFSYHLLFGTFGTESGGSYVSVLFLMFLIGLVWTILKKLRNKMRKPSTENPMDVSSTSIFPVVGFRNKKLFNDKRDEAVSRLRELAQLRDEGVLTQEEYDEKAEKYKKLI